MVKGNVLDKRHLTSMECPTRHTVELEWLQEILP